MRPVHVITRTVAILLGLVLLALGAGAIAWWSGRWPATAEQQIGQFLDLDWAADTIEQGWWRWGTLGVGLALVLLSLWWVSTSLHRLRVRSLRLPGSSAEAILGVRTSPVIAELDRRLCQIPGVVKARSVVLAEHKVAVLNVTLWAEPDVDLAAVDLAAAQLFREVAAMFGRSTLDVRVHLAVTRRVRSRRSRVH